MKLQIIEKEFKEISREQLIKLNHPFICFHSSTLNGYPYFSYLIVDLSLEEDKQFIARFKDLLLAVEYMKLKYNLT